MRREPESQYTQFCEVCDDEKPLVQFGRRKRSPNGRANVCRACVRAANNKANKDPAIIRKRRDARLRRLYGITLGDYEAMGRRQRWRCAICGRKAAVGDRLVVDHDHDKPFGRAVRRLLCRGENSALGHFGDSSERVAQGAAYLREHGK
ncbi:endonuclease domain-containing protein [Kitasatospora sp. MBT66]|uniref:endonuclease domain-containing protein n=1 Tax=Kitasatospora sp. MBT66 TaxID=1444769 RepID=UPI000691CBA2|nr:endonuclease domain-containing protein [Kitasatospora sp. MBT66]